MKKILFTCIAGIAMIGSTTSNAQSFWAGTPATVQTTTTGNCGIGGNLGTVGNSVVGGNFGIGLTTVTDSRLHIKNTIHTNVTQFQSPGVTEVKLERLYPDNQTSAYFQDVNFFEIWNQPYSQSSALKFVITPDIKVGIGLSNPDHKLDVNGDINAATDISAGGDLLVGDDATVSGDATISGTATVSTLANAGGGRLVIANGSGTLDVEYAPTLSVSSNTLHLTNSGTINTSVALPTWADNLSISGNSLSLKSGATTLNTVTIPSGADNLGNHIASTNLNMNYHDISNVYDIYGLFNIGRDINNCLIFDDASCTHDVAYFKKSLGVAGNADCNYALYVNGSIYTTGTYDGSDKRFKKDIETVKAITDELFKVQSYSYKFRQNEFKDRNFDDQLHFGFIAQDVKELFPNLVKEDGKGYYAINYTEFIPLLLQSLKEEDQKVKDLELRIQTLESKLGSTAPTYTDNATNTTAKSVLYQNTPNPFNVETNIKYNIVGTYNSAFIGVYDLNGRQLQRINIAAGSSQVTVKGLASGMYVYSLIVDGQLIDSKKMVMLDDK